MRNRELEAVARVLARYAHGLDKGAVETLEEVWDLLKGWGIDPDDFASDAGGHFIEPDPAPAHGISRPEFVPVGAPEECDGCGRGVSSHWLVDGWRSLCDRCAESLAWERSAPQFPYRAGEGGTRPDLGSGLLVDDLDTPSPFTHALDD